MFESPQGAGNLPSEIEIEDKQWSVVILIKKAGYNGYEKFANAIAEWAEHENLSMHRGLNVLELQLLPGFNKSVGVSFLASLLKIDTQKDSIIYAGDDDNDAVAMLWTLLAGGTAIKSVPDFDVVDRHGNLTHISVEA